MIKNNSSVKNFFFGLFICSIFYVFLNDSKPLVFKHSEINIGSQTLITEVAISEQQKTTGLMYREYIDDTTMLFQLDKPQKAKFWMKNVKFDLEIAFIDSFGNILEIIKMDKDNGSDNLHVYQSKSNQVLYALEARVGLFNEKNIKSGDKITITESLFK